MAVGVLKGERAVVVRGDCRDSRGGLGVDTTSHSVVRVPFSMRYTSTALPVKGDRTEWKGLLN